MARQRPKQPASRLTIYFGTEKTAAIHGAAEDLSVDRADVVKTIMDGAILEETGASDWSRVTLARAYRAALRPTVGEEEKAAPPYFETTDPVIDEARGKFLAEQLGIQPAAECLCTDYEIEQGHSVRCPKHQRQQGELGDSDGRPVDEWKDEEDQLRELARLCGRYFEIASGAIGEEEVVRRLQDLIRDDAVAQQLAEGLADHDGRPVDEWKDEEELLVLLKSVLERGMLSGDRDRPDALRCADIQRVCLVGYSFAARVLERLADLGLVFKAGDVWQVRR
jgi:hypothetical protein